MIYYNPLDTFYKSLIGAVSEGDSIVFRVKGNFDSVILLVKKDDDMSFSEHCMIKKVEYFELSISLHSGLYFYCFKIDLNKFIGLSKDYLGVISDTPNLFQLTVYSNDYNVPTWLKGGVIYQIFPDRFNIGKIDKKIDENKILHQNLSDVPVFLPNEKGEVLNNDFFGGDLLGIINKIDYLKSLGVTAIYLNPIFKAFSNHRYDTGNYMEIDDLLGDINDFENLITCAEEKGIKVILDGVFNHTGDDSLYFNKYGNYNSVGAYQSKDSKYYRWFNFANYPDDYESWWGIKTLPAINESNDDYINFITGVNGVIDFWTRKGIGGWRLDVVDELPDFFVEKIRTAVKNANNDAIIIGEVWEDASNKISYGVRRKYFQGKELDSVMNYPLKEAIIDYVRNGNVSRLSYTIKELIDHYPKDVLNSLMNILSTHDTWRLLTAVGGENMHGRDKKEMLEQSIPLNKVSDAKFNQKAASLLQFTLCGVPCVYYGDEAGMQGYSDPLNRCFYPWGKEDNDLIDWYKFLGGLRNDYSVFSDGDFCEIYASDGVYVYTRRNDEAEFFIALNLGDNNFILTYDDVLYEIISQTEFTNSYDLMPKSFCILIKNH